MSGAERSLALTPEAVAAMIADARPTPELVAALAKFNRDAMRDKSWELCPMGEEVAAYLRHKRKRLTDESFRMYEGRLARFARHYPDLELRDFELPVGAQRVEEYLDDRHGGQPGTYNATLSIVKDFFEWHVRRGLMHSNPCTLVDRAKTRDVYRTTFSGDQRRAIIASAEDLRDRIALRLLLDYGIRKGALSRVQFKHFDHQRKRLTIFTKGQKVHDLPLPDPHLWMDLERHILDVEAQPSHFLMCVVKPIPRAGVRRFPERPMSSNAAHRWWYRRLEDAGVVAKGETSGERMHKARHTAGQRVLDATKGNLKAVQKLLGHANIQTTGNIYTDWDDEALAATLADVLKDEDE